MSETTDKLLERIPHFQGDFRRRFGSGAIVVVAVSVAVSQLASTPVENQLRALITTPSTLIVIAVLAYMIGHLTEMVSDVFVARLAGNLAWAFIAPRYWFNSWPRYLRYPARTICWFPGFGFLISWYVIRSLVGVSDYDWKTLENRLSKHSLSIFHTLPPVVQTGLRQPFGIYQEVAWEHLKQIADPHASLVIVHQRTMCRDVLSITSALLLALLILSMVPSIDFSIVVSKASDPSKTPILIADVIMYASLMLLIGYMHTVWKAIITALEVLSTTRLQTDSPPGKRQEG